MITIDNYFNKIGEINFKKLPEAIQKGHEFILKGSKNGASWTFYSSSPTIKKTVDIYLSKLNEYLNKNAKPEKPQKTTTKKISSGKSPAVQQAESDIKKYPGLPTEELERLYQFELDQQRDSGLTPDIKIRRKALLLELNKRKHQMSEDITFVEKVPEELRFIKRYVNLNGKTKTKEDILRFINSLQKAIIEKRIRKTSPYADQIRHVQEKLISVYNTMKAKIKLELKPETYEEFKKLTAGEKVMASINLLKAYIRLNGKPGMKKKAEELLKKITRLMDKKVITMQDPYIDPLLKITENLEKFLNAPSAKILNIEKNELNGLEGILGCACQNLNGIYDKPAIMNSMDFANMQFDTLGFTGKWLDLIGDPSSNFTAMVFGKPKMGKSYLCVDFAGYLARNHGKVLYVANEEGLDYTLQQKLNDKDVAHPNLYVASVLPAELSLYDFIFLDSVNRLGLSPEDLNRLKKQNPSKSFIFVFQSTKDGKFRGANTFQHDVDIVIEVPEKGKAIGMGRFNQGGEMEIFDGEMAA